MKSYFAFAVLLGSVFTLIGAGSAFADPIATCTVTQRGVTLDPISIDKYTGVFPTGMPHTTRIFVADEIDYEFLERSGSSTVEIGRGHLDEGGAVTFQFWQQARLPMTFVDLTNETTILCQ